jgi:hypothetical protein
VRVEGWETRLAEAVAAAQARPFAWGEHDCATWAFDVRRALTGADAAEAWRGRYRTAIGARRVLRRVLRADSHQAAATAILGAPLATQLLAQRGDIVLLSDAFGVCLGADCAFLAPNGLTFRPLSETELAWRV